MKLNKYIEIQVNILKNQMNTITINFNMQKLVKHVEN